MFTVFNILVIAMVGLIAYWWANQGVFSAILHLLCVIVAGAVTLAVWEPLTVGLLLRGNGFDDYAWGVSFIGIFSLTLLILRVTLDKTIGGNVDLPQWANLVFGFPIGAAAGILTFGMFLIGAGFIQSSNELMGFYGVSRTKGKYIENKNELWLPVHQLTADFYSMLSVNALSTDQPLNQYYPHLAAQAASLQRDTFLDGRAKTSLRPEDARVDDAKYSPGDRRYSIHVNFESPARDFGEQLTLSASQITLIGEAKGGSDAKIVHPDRWTQWDGSHVFDDPSHYITTQPGQATGEAEIEFDLTPLNGAMPRFVLIRGTRYKLPQPKEVPVGSLGGGTLTGAGSQVVDAGARDITGAMEQTFDIRPVMASTNQKPSGIELTEKFISGGEGDFMRNNERPPKGLAIQGIMEPPGTRIVQIDVSRESTANIFAPALQAKAGDNAKIMLVDNSGRAYYPIGFIHEKPDSKTFIKVDSSKYVGTMSDIPALPTAGGQKLKLLFAVTENVTIVGLKLGNATVGNSKFYVKDPKAAASQPSGSFGLTK